MASRRSKLPDSFPKQWPVYQQLYGKLTDDEWAAHCFLAGYDQHFSAKGDPINYSPDLDPIFVRVSYLSGELESFGREALIRVLERALKTERLFALVLLKDLIGLFGQNDPTEERKLIFRFRSRKPHFSAKPRAIANYIQKLMVAGEKWDNAVKEAREVFGRNGRRTARSTITDAWAWDKKQFPELHRPVRSVHRSGRT